MEKLTTDQQESTVGKVTLASNTMTGRKMEHKFDDGSKEQERTISDNRKIADNSITSWAIGIKSVAKRFSSNTSKNTDRER